MPVWSFNGSITYLVNILNDEQRWMGEEMGEELMIWFGGRVGKSFGEWKRS